MAVKVKSGNDRLEGLLFSEFVFGSERDDAEMSLSRAMFYTLTLDMSDEALGRVFDRAKEHVLEDYLKRYPYEPGDDEKSKPQRLERLERRFGKFRGNWMRPWTRLAGRMDLELFGAGDVPATVDEARLSEVCGRFKGLPEYVPYVDNDTSAFYGYVFNKCSDLHLDYFKVDAGLRTRDLEERFLDDFPFLVEECEWAIMGKAYTYGSPRTQNLAEAPSRENGYIGGETRWSRYFPISHGPTFESGRVTALGMIDYKDCTNHFAVFGDGQRAVPFYSIGNGARKALLERVYDTLKYVHNASLAGKLMEHARERLGLPAKKQRKTGHKAGPSL